LAALLAASACARHSSEKEKALLDTGTGQRGFFYDSLPWQQGKTDHNHLAGHATLLVYRPIYWKVFSGPQALSLEDYSKMSKARPDMFPQLPEVKDFGETIAKRLTHALQRVVGDGAPLPTDLPIFVYPDGTVYAAFDILTMYSLFPGVVAKEYSRTGGIGYPMRPIYTDFLTLKISEEVKCFDTDWPNLGDKATYTNVWTPRKPLPSDPSIFATASTKYHVIKALLQKHRGVFFGEISYIKEHDKIVLCKAMETTQFRLILGHITVDLQPYVDQYLSHEWLDESMPPVPLAAYLNTVTQQYDLFSILKACKEHNIPVVLFESSKTYNYDPDAVDDLFRVPSMNYYLTRAIDSLDDALPFVAFVGLGHFLPIHASATPFVSMQAHHGLPLLTYYQPLYEDPIWEELWKEMDHPHPLDREFQPDCNLVIVRDSDFKKDPPPIRTPPPCRKTPPPSPLTCQKTPPPSPPTCQKTPPSIRTPPRARKSPPPGSKTQPRPCDEDADSGGHYQSKKKEERRTHRKKSSSGPLVKSGKEKKEKKEKNDEKEKKGKKKKTWCEPVWRSSAEEFWSDGGTSEGGGQRKDSSFRHF